MGTTQSTGGSLADVDFDSYTGKRYTQEVPNTRDDNHGPAYEVPDKEPVNEAEMTLYHNFLTGCRIENGTRPCYGQRPIDLESGKAGPYEWFTYNEVKTRMDDVASGMQTTFDLKRQDKVGIFAQNQLKWCLLNHACDRMSYVLVPLYDTLGPDAVPFVISHTELSILFCGKKQFDVVMNCASKCPTLKMVVLLEPISDEQKQLAVANGIEVKTFEEIEEKGKAELQPADPPLPTDISTLCYTSGTVGDPKGVVLLQRNFTYAAKQASNRLKIYPTDVHICYLPLVHVLERVVLALMHVNGASAGFYQGDLRLLMDDIAVLHPTVFVTVPRLVNRVYDKITQGVEAAGGVKKMTFDQAITSKLARVEEDRKTHALWDLLLFNKLHQVLGGNVRLIFSGSAPMSADVKKFMQAVFCCDVVEGYGLSESAAAVCIGAIDMPTESHVGTPVMYAQVQLEDVSEMGYTSNDKPRPRGEILVKGPEMFTGYYQNEEMTRETIDERGWFHTGDIGCWNADGTLSIIDRKKNIFKLAQGEYVAAEKIENVYAKSKFVAQLFVYGDSLQSCLVGVLVPDPDVLKAWAQDHGLSGDSASKTAVLENKEFREDVREDMDRVAKEAQLRGFECVKGVHFHAHAFTSEDGLITPTFKLKRPQLKRYFHAPIKKLYEQLTPSKRLKEEMEAKEWHRNTTSMSAGDERVLLRELQSLKEKLTQQETCDEFQKWVDDTRQERQERFEKHKEFDATLQQLQLGIRKLKLAQHIKKPVADFVTIEVTVPTDKMGAVIGKQFTHVHQVEKDCCAILEVDNKQNIVHITSAPEQARAAKEAIEDITLATNHLIGLHPDTVKVLMFQQAKHLHELEKSLHLKIDVSKAEGILTVLASPSKAKQLEKAIADLTDGKVDISLPAEIVPKLIGKKGETINQLMEDTGALVDIDKVTNMVRLCGTKESVVMAEKFVRELIDEQSQRERNYSVENKDLFCGPEFAKYKFEFFAEFLMANKAKQLRLLRTDASDARIKVFKKERRIHVMGNKKQLDAMGDALRERLKEFESHHWVYEVQDHHLLSLIIGKKGSKIKEIESEGKDSNVRIDIQDDFVCVFGDDEDAISSAKVKIMEIVDKNQRSVFVTSRYLIAILMASKREKLSEIEKSSGCKLYLPPPPSAGASRSSDSESDQIKISLNGTLEAIQSAKLKLEELDEANHVRYLPLDNDEIPTVIGKGGETVSELESKSGAKVRVLRGTGDQPSELEMIGTQDQLKIVQAAVDELLQTQNRQLLQLDAFATGCLIGRKGERIKAMRLAHPEATLDAFPNRGQVRVKAATPEALQACVDDVLKTLRETHVIESVQVPQQEQQQQNTGLPRGAALTNFSTLIQKHEAIAMRLQELEAEGGEGMKVSIQEEGKVAKIRGPAVGIGKVKKFLEMLVSTDSHFVETISLPSIAFASALEVKGEGAKLNENALRISKQTGCELRIKRSSEASGSGEEGTIRIEGTNATKVYEAKASVEKVLQFYYTECFDTIEDLPPSIVSRMYELLPTLRAKYRVVFSLPSQTSLKIFTDSKDHTKEITTQLKSEIKTWKKQHVELPVVGWLVPILVGRSGETIKKISSECNARLDLSAPSPLGSRHENRVLTISARDDAAIKLAAEKVQEVLTHHKNLSSVVDVSKAKLDVALSVKKDAKGLQFHVVDGEEKGALQVVIYGSDHDERERIVEKVEHLLEIFVVETIALPTTVSTTFANSMIGSFIGRSGANIRALQKQFPDVMIDIRRDDNSITLKGPTEEVAQVRTVMEDKIQELLRNEEDFQQRRASRHQPEAEEPADDEKKTDSSRDATEVSDEKDQLNPVRQQVKRGPVGGMPFMGEVKLTKNQRRRMRKRAENEKTDVLSMLVGNGQSSVTTTTTTTTVKTMNSDDTSSTTSTTTNSTTGTNGGYYHSSSGYSLRL
ncbi:hypothetical protein BBO99_00007620 [Phytophthora kernoviae]|uniref:K Homology domain-containing protein n=1 Tax=Phytophthora kernoviae TaxID=325452 RepID=A0A3R7JQP4_9STRA|nr:hypothetical protein BBI17_007569 [Phytophthora kernoviae]RLN76343.1 hypothetical protein BBO99_00007620 [Phytophthora kernoviae]